ncbi:hypothetical protein IQ07DRAFT_640592 [Pyrenochaeta sp. DS3sAY3a]|nr:hypothetical protein IQ07DRAFT_640592 [Pyrenochaeta sp. DS3sAY3a]
MLEQQQTQMVLGLRVMYYKLKGGEGWPGAPLNEAHGGIPLTHDILERLNVLYLPNSQLSQNTIEDNLKTLQSQILRTNGMIQDRGRREATSESVEPCPRFSTPLHGVIPPAQSSAATGPYPQQANSLTQSTETDFYRLPCDGKSQFPTPPTFMPSIPNSTSAELLHVWVDRQLPLDISMEVDLNIYDSSMSWNPRPISKLNSPTRQELAMNWEGAPTQFIDPSVLHVV